MKRSETSPNRKAFPKFLKWLLISAVFGFCVGIASGILDDLDVGVWLTDGLIRLLTVIAPWGIPISSVVLLGNCLWHYRSAKSLFDRWDGEDDSAPEEADRKLNVVLLCSTLALILDFFFLAVSVVYIEQRESSPALVGELVLSLIPGDSGPAENRGPDPANESGKESQRLRHEISGEVVRGL